jgi:Tol biopolymer transport system component
MDSFVQLEVIPLRITRALPNLLLRSKIVSPELLDHSDWLIQSTITIRPVVTMVIRAALRRGFVIAALIFSCFVLSAMAQVYQVVERVSIASDGSQANNSSFKASSISADGRYVAFTSRASNLVAGDTNDTIDVFVRDRQTGQTTRVSIASDGSQANNRSSEEAPSISANGRYVAFSSDASNLVPGDTNNKLDVFVYDRQTGQTRRVSVASNGSQANNDSFSPSISVDGRFIAFTSRASNLVAGDTNNTIDTFLHDRDFDADGNGNGIFDEPERIQTTRVSVASNGSQANDGSEGTSITPDSRFIAFSSDASNLVAGDTTNTIDVFARDRQTGQTTRVSIASDGSQANANSSEPSISANGRFVVFSSDASNLVAGDTNIRRDIFVHDRQTGQTTRLSVASDGSQGNGTSFTPSISLDGHYVAFYSDSNLVAEDTNNKADVFVYDRQTGQTRRVSVPSNGSQANNDSFDPSISVDGRFVAFISRASNLIAGDTNNEFDIFIAAAFGQCPDGSEADTDGDGLLDCWERDGIDFDGDGMTDFRLEGGRPQS